MAAKKLFGDFPGNVSKIPGMVTPAITSDITQKSEEDDSSTLAGYRKRLQAQREEQEAAARAHSEWSRQMQLQWEQEDLRKQARQMEDLDRQRRQAFNLIYEPEARQQVINLAQTASDKGWAPPGATQSTSPQSLTKFTSKLGAYTDQATGGAVIPGFGIVGGTRHSNNAGVMVPGAAPQDVQRQTNTMWADQQRQRQMQNVNPYYKAY